MHELNEGETEAGVTDEAARRILNLLFILNSSTTPLTTEQIISDSDLGYGSASRDSDMRKFRRDRERLAQHGIFVCEVQRQGDAQNEESSWAIDRERTYARIGFISPDDADTLLRALRDALKMPAAPYRSLLLKCYRRLCLQLSSPGEHFEHPFATDEENPIREGLWWAFVQRLSIRFAYTDARAISSVKRVDIYGMFTQQGNSYLVGKDTELDSIRTYRVDRITRLWRPRGHYRIPEDFSIEDYLFLPFDLAKGKPSVATFSFPAALGQEEIRGITHGRGSLSSQGDIRFWYIEVRDFAAAAKMAAAHASRGMRPHAPQELVDAWNTLMETTVKTHEAQ